MQRFPLNPTTSPSDWQLPPGVTRGTWQYAQAPFIATDYDTYFREHSLLELDAAIVRRHLTRPGVIVDLGCGTGRALLPLVRAGFRGIGIDLSQSMLEVLRQKADRERLEVQCLRGNLVELDFLAEASVDYALCLFSTLGMICGEGHRQGVLRHVHRIVRPGGLLVLHVHNFWHNLWWPQGRDWLLRNLIGSGVRCQIRGDKRYDYRGIRQFYLHLFTAPNCADCCE